jgi:hypothetical protein
VIANLAIPNVAKRSGQADLNDKNDCVCSKFGIPRATLIVGGLCYFERYSLGHKSLIMG